MQTGMPEQTHEEQRIRQRVLQAGLRLLAEKARLTDDLIVSAARVAGCTPEQALRFFPRPEAIVFALYARFAADLEAMVPDLASGSVSSRFEAVMRARFAQIAPYHAVLSTVLGQALDPSHELGALSESTEIIRLRVQGIFSAVVLGADDRPADDATAGRLARTLYAAHLTLLLLAQSTGAANAPVRAAMRAVCSLLSSAGQTGWNPIVTGSIALLDGLAQPIVDRPPDAVATKTAEAILQALFRHRRLAPDAGDCAANPCPQCLALHVPRVRHFVLAGQPIPFLLPAFPAKSPSLQKVLGPLPDRAEEIALEYLAGICREIEAIYPPGARILICSDGSVFSDLVGVTDDDLAHYGQRIQEWLAARYPASMDHFALEDLFGGGDFAQMREELTRHYAEPLEAISERIHSLPRHQSLFNGIHRFLIEEYPNPDGTLSKNRIRELCKPLTLQVIQRSEAWGRLIGDCFPAALRLSIHPQAPHAEKIGIRLADTDDLWITPWHGVAVERTDGSWTLMKRAEAEALPGARLVCDATGQPSYFCHESAEA